VVLKKKYKLIDFYKFIWNIYALVIRLEYDCNRNALIALIIYTNSIFNYIIGTQNLKIGKKIINKNIINYYENYSLFLKFIKKGIKICNIEKKII